MEEFLPSNQRITDTDVCIFVCTFVHICVYSFFMCYIRFGAYPNHIHIQIIVKKKLVGKERETKKRERKIKNRKEKHNSTD
jgi:hypothetical protein